jgi:hypothetical protein
MSYVIEGDNVYYEDERTKQHVGMVNKVETERIDSNTVADISYQFDLALGKYVEVSRITRAEPAPPAPISIEDKVNQVKTTAEVLDERTLGMQAIDDFTLQAQATIDDRTKGMQEIDDFTLQLVNDQATIIAQLQADVATLKGGV